MALARPEPPAESAGHRTRLRFGVQFALAALLFGALALFLTRLAEFSWARVRMDWTQGSENTLEPDALKVLAQLPDEVTIDVFLRAADYPLEELVIQAQERLRRLLYGIRDASGGRVRLVQHDLSGGRVDERTQTRLAELGAREVPSGGLVAVSCGKRNALVKLRGEIADFDPGDARGEHGAPRPAALVSFRGEEALVNALLKVARSDSPRILFSTGHGEFDTASAEILGLDRLKAALEADGFVVGTWDGQKTPEVPDDCRVLAVVGPQQAFSPAEFAALRRYVERGGRLFAAPHPNPLPEQNSLGALLSPWGVEIAPRGLVCRPVLDVAGQPQTGKPDCGWQIVDQSGLSQHTITDVLRRSGRRVAISNAHALDIRSGLPGSTVLRVLNSAEGSWLDLPQPGGMVGDWLQQDSERRGVFVLAAAILFPPQLGAGPPLRLAEDQRAEAHVFVFGAALSLANANLDDDRDLLLNAFNWAAAREWRISVSVRNHVERRVDLQDARVVSRLHFGMVVALPLLSLLLGLFTAWRRRR